MHSALIQNRPNDAYNNRLLEALHRPGLQK